MLKVANSVINASQITGVLPVANGGTGVSLSTGTLKVVLSDSPTLTGQLTTKSIYANADASATPMDTTKFNMQGTGGNWIIRTGTDFSVNIDVYNSGSNSNAFSISQTGIIKMAAYGAGTATFSAAGVISSVSDETWKIKDGVPTNPDAMLKKLEPGYWYYNDEKKETFGTDRQLGFYAQNVNAAIGPEAAPEPETFTIKNEDGVESIGTKPWGYYDRSVLAVAVMSLQKALATIENLTARVKVLENK